MTKHGVVLRTEEVAAARHFSFPPPRTTASAVAAVGGVGGDSCRKQLAAQVDLGAAVVGSWLESMKASSPRHRLMAPLPGAADAEHDDWMERHPSALDGFDALAAAAQGKQVAVFLDYDGTLSPIVEDPDRAVMTDERTTWYGTTPPAMSTPGSRAMTVGLTVMLLCVSAGLHFHGFGLLLCFVGVLIGTSLVAAGVRMANGPALYCPIVPMVSRGARALTAFMRRNTATVGLVMASCAFTVVSGEQDPDPMLCFGMFILLLLGLAFVNIGALRE